MDEKLTKKQIKEQEKLIKAKEKSRKQQHKLFKKELKEEIAFRKSREKLNDFIKKWEQCEHTKLSIGKVYKKEKEVLIYFYSVINGGVFGKMKVKLLDDYRICRFNAPVVEFINPKVYIDCSLEYSLALTPRKYIDSILICEDLYFPPMDWNDDSSIAELLRYFPNEKFKSKI